ncbi:MAG: hypothetical protein EWM72_02034 [Nitrospira sp.]|nr:MAG: hypothetical protein EWM72_02034 [Nitrospira sp.]
MEKSQHVSGDEDSMPPTREVPMEAQIIQETNMATSKTLCAHQRLIDEVLTRSGKRTGKVRCLECGTIFEDPYRVQQ